jgi:hypothetical protein
VRRNHKALFHAQVAGIAPRMRPTGLYIQS